MIYVGGLLTVGNTIRVDFSKLKTGNNKVVIGKIVDVVPAYQVPSIDEMKRYWYLNPEDEQFKAHRQPLRLDRFIIEQDNGNYCIIPETLRRICERV